MDSIPAGSILTGVISASDLKRFEIHGAQIASATIQAVSRLNLHMPWYRRVALLTRAAYRGYIDLQEVQRAGR